MTDFLEFTFPTDEQIAAVDHELAIYQGMNNPASATAGMRAIRACVAIGCPIPEELYPWVLQAVEAWEDAKGHRQRVRSEQTQARKEEAVRFIVSSMGFGFKREHAIDQAAKAFGFTYGTLENYYEHPSMAAVKSAMWDIVESTPARYVTGEHNGKKFRLKIGGRKRPT